MNLFENVQKTNDWNSVHTHAAIPMIDCQEEQQVPKYKDLDHSRNQRYREKFVQSVSLINQLSCFIHVDQ